MGSLEGLAPAHTDLTLSLLGIFLSVAVTKSVSPSLTLNITTPLL